MTRTVRHYVLGAGAVAALAAAAVALRSQAHLLLAAVVPATLMPVDDTPAVAPTGAPAGAHAVAHASGPEKGTTPAHALAHAAANAPAKLPDAAPVAKRGAAARRTPPPAVVTIEREVFDYGGAGRRDPFKSLLTTNELRPALGELRLVAVAYDPSGAGSVAILRDVTGKTQYRVRQGTLLGRMRVAGIRPKAVVFTIEELGYSRQETLGLNDSTAVRGK